MKNIIEDEFTQADRDKILGLIAELEDKMAGKVRALTEEERVRYGSINEQNKLLVNRVNDYRQNQPNLSSPDVNWDEFANDRTAREFLENVGDRLSSLSYQARSTKILHDYDNYNDALADYAYTQYKKGAGASGATEKAAELKQFFPKTKKNTGDGEGGNR